ncbi:hypothetical protein D3C81_412570 [compost metagenome]
MRRIMMILLWMFIQMAMRMLVPMMVRMPHPAPSRFFWLNGYNDSGILPAAL